MFVDLVCETPDTGRRWTPPDGGILGLADQFFYFNLNINNLTSELEVPGTWELEVPGIRELRNLGTHSRVSQINCYLPLCDVDQ